MIAAAAAWLRADARRFDVVLAATVAGVGFALVLAEPSDFNAGWPEVVGAVGAFVVLTLRRRWTVLLLAVAMVWVAVHIAIWGRPTPMIFSALVLTATACLGLDRAKAIALGVVVAASLYGIGVATHDFAFGDSRAVILVAWTAVAVGIADAIRSWQQYKESADAQVRSAVLASEAQSRQRVTEERLTIARELHDLLAHNLSVMNVQTGAALHLLHADPAQAEASLSAARDAGRSVLDELSELLAVLRLDDDEAAPNSSLPSADELPSLVGTMRTAGLDVTWTRTGVERQLAPAVSLAAYRIAQEALTNAAKHGDGAAELTTEWETDGLVIRVANRSNDSVSGERGLGLVGMRERAVANGGRLEADRVGNRFVVDAWLPATVPSELSS